MTEYTDEDWEEIGSRWRKAAGMHDVAYLDAPAFIQWLKRAGHIKNYVCVPDHEPPTAEGKHDPNKGIIFFRQSTWDAAQQA